MFNNGLLKQDRFAWSGFNNLSKQRKIPFSTLEYLYTKGVLGSLPGKLLFEMRDLEGNKTGVKIRFLEKTSGAKSICNKGDRLSYFYDEINFSESTYIVEGEIDYLTIFMPGVNLIGIPGIGMLPKLIEELQSKGVPAIYLLVDNDDPADAVIGKLIRNNMTENVFDCRKIFAGFKDVNDFVKANERPGFDKVKEFGSSLDQQAEAQADITKFFWINQETGYISGIEEELLALHIVENSIISSDNGNAFIYEQESGLWRSINKYEIGAIVISYIKKYLEILGLDYSIHKANKDTIVDFILVHSESSDTKKLYNSNRKKEVALQDGILDLKNWEFRPFCKTDYRMSKFPYSYDQITNLDLIDAKNRNEFLDQVLAGWKNPEKIKEMLQEFFGYLLIPSTEFEKSLLLFGSGANGKGTILETFMSVLGQENYSTIGMHEITNDQNIYLLLGKLANFDLDMNQNVQIDNGNIKKLVVGEPVVGKLVYKAPVNFSPYAKFVIATNELPYVKSIDASVSRRFIFLELKQSFQGKEDFGLKKKLKEEAIGIFSWGLYGLERLLSRGHFLIPDELRGIVNEFVESHDTIQDFLNTGRYEKCEANTKDGHYTVTNTVYADYVTFCKDLAEIPMPRGVFSKRLKELGFQLEKVKGERVVLGLI